ncbi:TPA: hypothetical protein ACH3X1_001221 [Trebouxia sp. C0004]
MYTSMVVQVVLEVWCHSHLSQPISLCTAAYDPAYNSWEPERTLKRNAPETLSDYWDELEAAVQAAEPEIGSDTGLAPSDQIRPASRGIGRGRGRGRGRTGRGRGLRPVSKSLKK